MYLIQTDTHYFWHPNTTTENIYKKGGPFLKKLLNKIIVAKYQNIIKHFKDLLCGYTFHYPTKIMIPDPQYCLS